MRIGHGFDVHALVTGRKCIIGGVDIPHDKGLDGHSDADVPVSYTHLDVYKRQSQNSRNADG